MPREYLSQRGMSCGVTLANIYKTPNIILSSPIWSFLLFVSFFLLPYGSKPGTLYHRPHPLSLFTSNISITGLCGGGRGGSAGCSRGQGMAAGAGWGAGEALQGRKRGVASIKMGWDRERGTSATYMGRDH